MNTETHNKYGSTDAALVAAHECYGIRNALEIQCNNIRNMLKDNQIPGKHGFPVAGNKDVAKTLNAVLTNLQNHYARNEERLEDVLPYTI